MKITQYSKNVKQEKRKARGAVRQPLCGEMCRGALKTQRKDKRKNQTKGITQKAWREKKKRKREEGTPTFLIESARSQLIECVAAHER